ncbi:MAG: diguanylate cyclase [Ideonella sp.]|nr:diguanylate cyclase [Ideonella sp.]
MTSLLRRICAGTLRMVALCAGAALCALLFQGKAGATEFQVELSYLVDPDRRLELADVQQQPGTAWRLAGGTNLSLGYTDAAVWFRIRVKPYANSPRDGVLEIGYPVLGELRVHRIDPTVSAAEQAEPMVLGALLPFERRPMIHRNFVLPFTAVEGVRQEWLVRVVTPTSMQFPLAVHDRQRFERSEQGMSTAHGIYIGVVLAMLAYNLYLWVVSRESAYFWYVAWMLTIAGLVLTMAGVSYQWLWPESPDWNLASMPFLLSAAAFSGVLFFSGLVRLPEHWPMGWQLARALVGLQLFAILVALIAPYKIAIMVGIACAVLSMLSTVLIALWMSLRQSAAATSFLKTFAVFVVGGVVLTATKLGWLPASPWLNHTPQVSTALAMLLFSIMLAARVESERRLREQAQREVVAKQAQWNAELERKVEERTDELQRLNQALSKLSRTDALTGLFNRRYLEECMDAELARSQQQHLMMAVYMLDIDHFKRLNDSHGHAAGDECLRAVAQRLLACTRVGEDVLVRWGGEEFCLLALVWDVAAASSLGERLRACVSAEPVGYGDTQIDITVSLGIAVGAPRSRQDVLDIQLHADESLYAAKATGRNRWVMAPVASGLSGL